MYVWWNSHLVVCVGSVGRGPLCSKEDDSKKDHETSHSETNDTCLLSKPLTPPQTQHILLIRKQRHRSNEKAGSVRLTWWKETGETSKRTSVFKDGTSDLTILWGWKWPNNKDENYIELPLFKSTNTQWEWDTQGDTHCLLSKDPGFLHRCSARGARDTEWKQRASPVIHHHDTKERLEGRENVTEKTWKSTGD